MKHKNKFKRIRGATICPKCKAPIQVLVYKEQTSNGENIIAAEVCPCSYSNKTMNAEVYLDMLSERINLLEDLFYKVQREVYPNQTALFLK